MKQGTLLRQSSLLKLENLKPIDKISKLEINTLYGTPGQLTSTPHKQASPIKRSSSSMSTTPYQKRRQSGKNIQLEKSLKKQYKCQYLVQLNNSMNIQQIGKSQSTRLLNNYCETPTDQFKQKTRYLNALFFDKANPQENNIDNPTVSTQRNEDFDLKQNADKYENLGQIRRRNSLSTKSINSDYQYQTPTNIDVGGKQLQIQTKPTQERIQVNQPYLKKQIATTKSTLKIQPFFQQRSKFNNKNYQTQLEQSDTLRSSNSTVKEETYHSSQQLCIQIKENQILLLNYRPQTYQKKALDSDGTPKNDIINEKIKVLNNQIKTQYKENIELGMNQLKKQYKLPSQRRTSKKNKDKFDANFLYRSNYDMKIVKKDAGKFKIKNHLKIIGKLKLSEK